MSMAIAAVWSRLSLTRVRLAILGVLLVLAAVAAFLQRGMESDRDSGQAARRATASSVEALLSYTPRNVESNLTDELAMTTGDFRSTYADLMRDKIVPAAAKQQASVMARVVGTGVVSSNGSEVKLVVFVNVTTTSSTGQSDSAGSRLEVISVRSKGTWRISELQSV